MEPFTILCETCAARLKVTQPQAIGQKLACPKCNSMVLVVPPEEVQIPADLMAETDSGFDFDDIEKILQESPAESAQPNRTENKARQKPTNGGAPNAPAPGNVPASMAPSNKPTMETAEAAPAPGESWTSEATKARQKWLLAAATAVGCLVLVAAVIGMMIGNAETRPKPVAQATEPPPEVGLSRETSSSPAEEGVPLEDPQPAKKGADPSSETAPSSPMNDPASQGTPNEDPNEAYQGLAENADKPGQETPSPALPTVSTEEPPSVEKENPVGSEMGQEDKTERPNGLDSLLIGMNKGKDDSVLNSNLGELSNLLEKKGTSILEINDLAAVIRNSEMIGLPRYHFDKPAPFDPGNLARLQDPCAGVQYEGISTLVALREISLITGVPFQWNLEAIGSQKIDRAAPINFKLVDKNFIEVVQAMLEPLGLGVTFDGTQIPLIEPIRQADLVERPYELPQLDDPDGEKISRFIASIQQLIDPASWQSEENPATIQRKENQLLIQQTPENHERIRNYLGKIQAGLQMAAGQEGLERRFANRWDAAREKTSQPFESRFQSPVTLGAMLNRFQQVSQVNVVVDWESVLTTGWTPQTIVPAKVEEKSVDEAIRQLVRTMGLTSRYIDANTIEITTFQSAANSRELEVYSCHEILNGNMTPEALMQALEGALNFNVNQLNNVRVIYEPECQCVIALAPQLVQRQIQAILDRLNGK
ncbi:MAG: hypothetical protein VYE64_05325 [Planctomycetota bacterium]|nr:hypothetical protein [Planctomycetota bacterium]